LAYWHICVVWDTGSFVIYKKRKRWMKSRGVKWARRETSFDVRTQSQSFGARNIQTRLISDGVISEHSLRHKGRYPPRDCSNCYASNNRWIPGSGVLCFVRPKSTYGEPNWNFEKLRRWRRAWSHGRWDRMTRQREQKPLNMEAEESTVLEAFTRRQPVKVQ
jgi:hypothetical protein